MMTREEAIDIIEMLYPADADYENTAQKERELLERAKREVTGWRTEPTEILIRYTQLCMEEEDRQDKKMLNKNLF